MERSHLIGLACVIVAIAVQTIVLLNKQPEVWIREVAVTPAPSVTASPSAAVSVSPSVVQNPTIRNNRIVATPTLKPTGAVQR